MHLRRAVELGSALGKRVNVEGVETLEQLELLKRSSIDEVQGFYFSKPLEVNDFERLLGGDKGLEALRAPAPE